MYFELPDQVPLYYLELCVLFIDEDRLLIERVEINTGWRENGGQEKRFETSFGIPAVTRHYVMLLTVQGSENETPVEDKRAMGMRVMKTGMVE
jgi:hypothetical protein